MTGYGDLKEFRFWCQKVLPLVYDDSLSYYEVLCRVVDYINAIINDSTGIVADLTRLKKDMAVVQKWIADFDTSYAEKIIEKYLATMIIVGISEAGYIVYYIPERWKDIYFETTGLDTEIEGVESGRLVLSY